MAGSTEKFVKYSIVLFKLFGPNNFNTETTLKTLRKAIRKNLKSIIQFYKAMSSKNIHTKCSKNLLSSEKFDGLTKYIRFSFKPHHNYYNN